MRLVTKRAGMLRIATRRRKVSRLNRTGLPVESAGWVSLLGRAFWGWGKGGEGGGRQLSCDVWVVGIRIRYIGVCTLVGWQGGA